MSTIAVADQTFVAAAGSAVSAVTSSESRWRGWWPDLRLTVTEDRGEKGIRWSVAGALDGTMEIWLESVLDGVVLHYFLHAEPKNQLSFSVHQRRVAGKRMAFEVKATVEGDRAAGEPGVVGRIGTLETP